MDPDTAARIEDWEASPFAGGREGLRELAAGDFSGAVHAGGAWLFMLNGRVVGSAEGALASVEGADGTAYRAPHPSLPLLFAMQETGGETEARYYTDDTPLAEVDRTLTEGNFTGYLELSENVLSGDYYVVYYGGRSLSAAFIGNEERLLTGEEAFERADDEVGIYEVRSVDLEVTEVPDPEPDAGAAPADEGTSDPDPAASDTASADIAPDPDTGDDPAVDEPGGGEPPAGSASDPESATAEDPAGEDTPMAEAEPSPEGAPAEDPDRPDEDPFSEEAEWRETRTIPSLDPEQSGTPADPDSERDAGESSAAARSDAERSAPTAGETDDADADREPSDGRVADLEATVDDLRGRLETALEEREQLETERDRLRRQVEDLRSGDGASGPSAERRLDRDEALAGTDLFVRYGSKGEATLEAAADGDASREAVRENLRLEDHTRFDAADVAVEGEPFADFLADTLEYRFVRWLVEDLLFEIQDTGSRARLADLYDALPAVDRVAFGDTITMRDDEGEERQRTFDVVCRDRMGQPLVVAALNDARDPATGEMMEDLVERATAVGEAHDELSAGFLVTASFFEPDALETAAAATGGGFLSRDSKDSYVKLSRKRGYHLCLVESRREEFHLAVPEL